jgi:precorrin-4/cobalt-precorrin-4 C11-methyltransferase
MEQREAVTVHFIGVGPGAADLITLRAQRLIASCPACVYAGALVPPEVLAHAPAGARLIDSQHLDLDAIVAEFVGAEVQAAGVRRCRRATGRPRPGTLRTRLP